MTMQSEELTQQASSIRGEVNYLSPETTINRRFVAPGEVLKTGTYEPHAVSIHDGRPFQDRFTLDRAGFMLLNHVSSVQEFRDRDELDAVYLAEVRDEVQRITEADKVVSVGYVLRRSEKPGEAKAQPPGNDVHVDMSATDARRRFDEAYRENFPEGPGYKRALITSFWRTFTPGPQDWPLAVAEYSSVADSEGVDTHMIWVDELPEDPYMVIEDLDVKPAGSAFHHNPDHRWWYFPNMTRDEVLFFKLNDTDTSGAWRVVHSAFQDTTVSATQMRESVEVRTIAFWE
ncbi:hypothetical protein A7K94_0200565 [Modestobacter sp. VKM Ac-2676]|nr:hypothetical protein A7K94_0200565 [Modestobacter sp. VKM Ac-2676]